MQLNPDDFKGKCHVPLDSINDNILTLNRMIVDENLAEHDIFPRCPATPFLSHSLRKKVTRVRRSGARICRFKTRCNRLYDGLHGTSHCKKKLVRCLQNAINIDSRTYFFLFDSYHSL